MLDCDVLCDKENDKLVVIDAHVPLPLPSPVDEVVGFFQSPPVKLS